MSMTKPPMRLAAEAEDVQIPDNLTGGHCAICGLQWGDEGKGQIVDLLTAAFDIVARYNGGNNAGHSVHIGDQKYALHLIPSGITHSGKLNVVGNGLVIDPAGIIEEIDNLTSRGVEVESNLRISNRAHVVLPYHKAQDALLDHAVAQAWEGVAPLGTTGRGIGPCYADKALRTTAIRMIDLIYTRQLKEKLQRIVTLKNAMLNALAQACGQTFEPFDPDTLYNDCCQHADRLRPFVCDTTRLLGQSIEQGKKILFEGANAALLDIDHGTYPFVTSSSCSSLGIYAGSGIPGGSLQNVVGIVKLYTSRVGSGPFPTEQDNEIGSNLRENGNEFGTTTGRPRRCGWLDLMAVKYTAKLSGATAIGCTGLSVLKGVEKIKVCIGYRYNGEEVDGFPADAGVLSQVEPIYEQFEGFDQPIDACNSYNQLPVQARTYVEFVEQYLGIPIGMVCVGKRRDQIIVRQA